MPKKKIEMYQRPNGLYERGVTIDGKRIRFRGKSPEEVIMKIAQYQGEKETGPKFKQLAEQWRNAYEKEVEYNTYHKSTAAYNRVKEYFGEMYIREITPVHISQFYNFLAVKKFSKKTVNNTKAILSNVFKYAIILGEVSSNPTTMVSIPKNLTQNKRELPSDDDIKKVKESIGCTFGLFPFLVMYTGCRKGEALALQYGDIDLENKRVTISKSAYFEGSKAKIKQPKTAAGIREIPLLDKLAVHIPKGKKEDYIFSSDGSMPYCHSAFNRLFKKYKEESGITATPHQLRHAYATMLYEAGIDEKLAQELLGHADISTTKNIYTHIRSKKIDDAANALNKLDF
ncbi:MAG: site-specific integrase [Oscillospiraceae bacterium]|nr:site-specific integrase [Oscillospiraceae bacterium]